MRIQIFGLCIMLNFIGFVIAYGDMRSFVDLRYHTVASGWYTWQLQITKSCALQPRK